MTEYRLKILQIIIPALTLIVLFRLFYWQVVRGQELASRAAVQHQQIATFPAHRGNIFASDGSLLAGTQETYLLYAYKPQLEIPVSQIIDSLAPILATTSSLTPPEPPVASPSATPTPPQDPLQQTRIYLTDRFNIDQNWISLKNYLSPEQKTLIENLDLKGVGFEPQMIRFYPEASLSAHLLGFVGNDINGQAQGYFGLEGYYDRQLQGRAGQIKQETDAFGNPILIGDFSEYSSHDGRDITTSINRQLQFQLENLLESGRQKYQAVSSSGIIMDSKTGAILAMASFPDYDPQFFYSFPGDYHKNPSVADLFEPGSIFKPLVMAASIDNNSVQPETRCDSTCSGPVHIGTYTIRTWNDEYHPNTDMTDVLVHSDNTGMVFAARRLGADRFYDYLAKFGFGHKTNIDLQEEVAGFLRPASDWKDIDLATISFGQGIAVTRLQLVSAINAIANQGNWIRPSIAQSITSKGNTSNPTTPAQHQVISKETATKVTQMMVAAVDRGEAKWAKPDNISIAGKTGTAQIPVEGHYDDKKTIASFVGFFPAQDPQITMLVTLREPQTSPWGSETAAPLWFDIARQVLLTLNTTP